MTVSRAREDRLSEFRMHRPSLAGLPAGLARGAAPVRAQMEPGARVRRGGGRTGRGLPPIRLRWGRGGMEVGESGISSLAELRITCHAVPARRSSNHDARLRTRRSAAAAQCATAWAATIPTRSPRGCPGVTAIIRGSSTARDRTGSGWLASRHRVVQIAWASTRLANTLRARFRQPTFHVPLGGVQRYVYGRRRVEAAMGRLVFIASDTEVTRHSDGDPLMAIELDISTFESEVRSRRASDRIERPRVPRTLDLAEPQQREVDRGDRRPGAGPPSRCCSNGQDARRESRAVRAGRYIDLARGR